jgi:hypothetical protein
MEEWNMKVELMSFNIQKDMSYDMGYNFKEYLRGHFKVKVAAEVGKVMADTIYHNEEIEVFLSRMPKDIQEDFQKLWDKVNNYILSKSV